MLPQLEPDGEDLRMDLADFLLARIAEDEAAATEARTESPSATWQAERRYDGVWTLDLRSTHPDSDSYDEGVVNVPREMAKHIARWDPARVLAECEAKRRIVEEYREENSVDVGMASVDADGGAWRALKYVIELLALPYAGHDQFREEWRV